MVVLHHLLDLPVDRVAAELDVPAGTVKSRLARARRALATSLAPTTSMEVSAPMHHLGTRLAEAADRAALLARRLPW